MGRRTWIKIYCDKWLRGTLREDTLETRGAWVDLLAMAGDSAFSEDGVIQVSPGVGLTDEQIASILRVGISVWLTAKERLLNTARIGIDGHNVIKIVNWHNYQSEYDRQKPSREREKLKIPNPESSDDDTCRQLTASDRLNPNPNPNPKHVHFEEFWKEYPRKEARVKAEQAFKSLNPSEKLLEIILDDISSRKQSEAWQKDGGKYIPLPATYLRGKRWEDETKKEAPNGKDRRYPEEKLYPDPDSYRLPVILSTDPAILKLHAELKGEKANPPEG